MIRVPEVGFEPTHPKITELKSAALDRSAIQAYCVYGRENINNTNQYAWLAEWSKATDSSSVLFGGVGSNPTSGN